MLRFKKSLIGALVFLFLFVNNVLADSVDSVVKIWVGTKAAGRTNWSSLSGFVFQDQDGYWVLSAGHLLSDDGSPADIERIIAVFRSGKRKSEELKLVGYDKFLDVSLLSFNNQETVKDVPPLKLGESKQLKPREKVVAISIPAPVENDWFEKSGTVINLTLGHASHPSVNQPQLIMHDCSINYGSSGSPLLNEKEEVVGINVLLIYPTVKEFDNLYLENVPTPLTIFNIPVKVAMRLPVRIYSAAVPIDDVKRVLAKLKKGPVETPPHPQTRFVMSGFYHETDLARFDIKQRPHVEGIIVLQIKPKSPAFLAGLRQGDIVLEADGKALESPADIYRVFYWDHDWSQPLTIKVDRFGQVMTFQVFSNSEDQPLLPVPEKEENK